MLVGAKRIWQTVLVPSHVPPRSQGLVALAIAHTEPAASGAAPGHIALVPVHCPGPLHEPLMLPPQLVPEADSGFGGHIALEPVQNAA